MPQRPKRAEVAPSARKDAARTPPRTGMMSILDQRDPTDYLACCRKPGWRPNDPMQTPSGDYEQAHRAVLATAYRAGLSKEMAKKFWHHNACRRWNGIDCGNTVAELAYAYAENWRGDDPAAYHAEQWRRKQAAANRVLS